MSGSFTDLFNGRLSGVMDQAAYDRIAPTLTGAWWITPFSDDGAFPYETDADEVATLLVRLADEVAARKRGNVTFPYTYIHTPDDPAMIKLYNPISCGSGCSSGSPKPWFVISRAAPTTEELAALRALFAPQSPSFLKRVFS